MSPFRSHRAVVTLLTGGLFVGTLVQAQAAEVGFFEALFGGARSAPQSYQPSPPTGNADVASPRHNRRASRATVRTRYAALPGTEALKLRITDRQKPIDMKGGAAAALMKDETLRPGDIVVLNSGARVFTGERETTHTMRDFEPVEHSAYVDRGTRMQLAALMAPASALPAEQARKFVERLKIAPRVPVMLVPQQASMRIINPWIVTP